jgi:putative ABC transport system permease protein
VWDRLVSTIRALVGRRAFEAELDEELRDHLERDVAHRIARGMSPVEARRTALAELGGVGRVKDDVREAHAIEAVDGFVRDLRFAFRRVRRAPHYSALVVVTIGLGVGAATAVFSAVDGVLLKPLPYAKADEIVTIWQTKLADGITRDDVSPANFYDLRERSTSFTGLAAANPYGVALRSTTSTDHIEAWMVTEDFMDLVGVPPMLGRAFRPEEFQPNAAPAVIVDHGFWQQRLGGDPKIVGSTLTLDGRPVTVVGVMPHGFELPTRGALWLPWSMREDERAERFGTYLKLFGRLRPGVTLATAQAELDAIAMRLEREYVRSNTGVGVSVVPLMDVLVGAQRPLLWTLLGAAGVLLLLTLANVAALHLTRLARQRREASVRAALGASRLRLARPLVAEAIVLASLGGAAGLALGWAGIRVLHALGPQDLPRLADIGLDVRAAGAAFLLAVVAAATLAALSVLRVNGTSGTSAFGVRAVVGSRASMRSRRVAVAAQLALALVLLTGTSLLVNSFLRVLSAERGYRTDHVLSFSTWVYDEYPDGISRHRFVTETLARLGALPGVRSVASGSALPLADGITGENADVIPEGMTVDAGQEPQARATVVTPGYFATLGMSLRRGRLFAEADDGRGARVIVVNETFARRYFPSTDPIGRTVQVGLMGRATPRTVVGIVGDTRHARLDAPPEPAVFIPWNQQPLASITFIMRTDIEPGSLAPQVSRAMFALDPRVAVARLSTLDALVDQRLRERRFLLVLLGAFATLAVTLASVGVFGVMSQTVVDRAREIGLRMALGATPGTILSQFVREATGMAVAGVVTGLVIAALATQGLSRFLYEVTRFDPLSLSAAAGAVIVLALLAATLPTLRAARTNPARVLGEDGS